MKVLIVCLGNICRSPMVEGWLRARIASDPTLRGRISVDSAGLGDWHAGQSPDTRAIHTAATHGIDISGQRARMLSSRDFQDFDLILCADRSTLQQAVARMPPASTATIACVLEWAGLPEPYDLADPYTGQLADFEAVWVHVEGVGERIVGRLRGMLGA